MSTVTSRYIIDTDPGIDDAQAILFALKSGFEVEAITTNFGNCNVEQAFKNAVYLTRLAGRTDIPVFRGADGPLVFRGADGPQLKRRLPEDAGAYAHGRNGFGDIQLPELDLTPAAAVHAAAELARRVVEQPGRVIILALAPLTNIALAMRLEPRFTSCVKKIVYMGGIISGPGNVSPVATANVLNDPEAAQIVFADGTPEKLVMVGQDVTRRTRITDDRRHRMHDVGSPTSDFLYEITQFYRDAYAGFEPNLPGFPAHDLLVMIYAIHPELFGTRELRVDIETTGSLTAGMTVGDLRPNSNQKPNVTVCLDVEVEKVLNLYERVMAQP